jgi:AcrR family transcriptional regulator
MPAESVDVAQQVASVDDVAMDASSVATATRPMRADALKNRARILTAAEEVFAADGVGVPIDAVAERAGVGVGTLYRHFPTKEALFEAVVTVRLAEVLEMAQSYAASDDPGTALFSFLREFAERAFDKRDLFEALDSAGFDIKSTCAAQLDELSLHVDVLLQRALAVHAVRTDVSADDVLSLVAGVCHSGEKLGTDEAGLQRLIGVIIDGLRPA